MEERNVTSVSERVSATASGRARLVSTLPDRVDAILDALVDPGSAALLIGEPGMGKTRIAQEVAYALEARLERPVAVTALLSPSHPMHGIAALFELETAGALSGALVSDAVQAAESGLGLDEETQQEAMQRVFAQIARAAEDDEDSEEPAVERVLIASGIDAYPPVTAYLFDQLVRSRRIRVIATAHHLTGAAALISGDPRVTEIHVKRFTLEETGQYLKRILGCEIVETRTLHHWHRITRGSALSLQMLATAMESRDRLGRRRGVVWELPEADGAPEEFGAYLRSICTPDELTALEIIAAAEPLSETVLLQLLDPEAVTSLRRRGLVDSRTLPNRTVALSVSSPVFRDAILLQAAPQRREELSARLFDALVDSTSDRDPAPSAERIQRLVRLGLEAGRGIPLDWLWQALEASGDPDEAAWNRRIALAVAWHPKASAEQAGIAALRAARETRVSGEIAHPSEVVDLLEQASEQLLLGGDGTSYEAIAIELEFVRALLLDTEDHERANRRLEALVRRVAGGIADRADERVIVVDAARAYSLACSGSLKSAYALCRRLMPAGAEQLSVQAEWARLKARLVESLVRAQQGGYTDAMVIAEDAKHFAEYGANPQREEADLLAFARFFAIWSSGSVEASRTALGSLERSVFSQAAGSGLVETGGVLQSLLEGRWRLAVQEGERLRDRLLERDVYGLRPLACAALALAFAALGEREEWARAVREAERQQHGLAQAMIGALRLLTLRARQWSSDDGAVIEAKRLAAWAAEEGLADIELKALHTGLLLDAEQFEQMLPRIESLAARIDLPLGALLARHAEELLGRSGGWDSPTARTLAEFGIWMPLPQTAKLSEREREIALLASLGYSSRWIAEQHFLSVRTVETHLRHVFTKLGASNRDELRVWFRRERQPV